MSKQAGPEAAAWQIWMPGADRSYAAARDWIHQIVAAGKMLSLPDEETPAAGQVLPGEFVLRDGTPAMIWPLLPTDADTLREGFRRLSPDSRQRRFLATLSELDAPMIGLLVDSADGVHHIALLLTVLPPEGEEGPAGVAHLVQDPGDPATADIAVTVLDDWQGRGAGTALVAALVQRRPAAVTRLRTLVAADNRASLALLARTGRMSSGPPEQGVLDVTVELPAATRARSAAEQVTDLWAQGARKFLDQTYLLTQLPQASLIPAVERYFEFVQQMVKMNRDLTGKWLEAARYVHSDESLRPSLDTRIVRSFRAS